MLLTFLFITTEVVDEGNCGTGVNILALFIQRLWLILLSSTILTCFNNAATFKYNILVLFVNSTNDSNILEPIPGIELTFDINSLSILNLILYIYI